jgi:hypothetical protein
MKKRLDALTRIGRFQALMRAAQGFIRSNASRRD